MLILDLIIEIQTCSERFYVRADTKEGAEEWIRTLRKAAVSLIDMQICTGQVLNVTVRDQSLFIERGGLVQIRGGSPFFIQKFKGGPQENMQMYKPIKC